ncbi:MAG TPA: SprT family zinc-dependent metalloprotease [Candidatus Limnocylindrales bacterium]
MTATPRREEALRSREAAANVELPGGPLGYILRHSPRARRLRLTVDPRRGVIVTVPAGRGAAAARRAVEPFLREREAWLRRHLERQAALRARLDGLARGELRDGAVVPYLGVPHVVRLVAGSPAVRRSTVTREGDADSDALVVRLVARDRRRPAAVLEAWLRDRARLALVAAIERHGPALGVRPAAVTLRDQRTRWGSATREGRLSFSWRLVLAPPEALETVAIHELAHLRVFGHGPGFWALVASRRPDHRIWRRWLREHGPELHAVLARDEAEPLPSEAA